MAQVLREQPARAFLAWAGIVAAFAAIRAVRPDRPKQRRAVARDDPLSPSVTRARREAEAKRAKGVGGFERFLNAIPYGTVFRDAAVQWVNHDAARLGAALAYYSIFSLGPLIVIAVAVAGLFLNVEAVRTELMNNIAGTLGPSAAEAIGKMLAGAIKPQQGIVAIVIGTGTLILAAIGVVMQLKGALNTVWETRAPSGGGIWQFLRTYLLSLAGVVALGFLLLVSMLATAALAALSRFLPPSFLGGAAPLLGSIVSFGVITVMFAAMFKWLPDAPVDWRDVWSGAILTAALFEIGKVAIAYYIGTLALESMYGAAASIIVILIWVYYSAQIVLFGAEFTNVIAKRRGARRQGVGGGQSKGAPQAVPAGA